MVQLARRFHRPVLVVTSSLAVLGAGLFIFSMTAYAERVERCGPFEKAAYWKGGGEFGARWTEPLPPSSLSRPPQEITITYSGHTYTTTLPTTLWEIHWPGLTISKSEDLLTDRAGLLRSIEVRLSTWFAAMLLSLYPCGTIVTGPLPRLARRVGWPRALGWVVVCASFGVAIVLILLAVAIATEPRSRIDVNNVLLVLFVVALPGLVSLSLLFLNRHRSESSGGTVPE